MDEMDKPFSMMEQLAYPLPILRVQPEALDVVFDRHYQGVLSISNAGGSLLSWRVMSGRFFDRE